MGASALGGFNKKGNFSNCQLMADSVEKLSIFPSRTVDLMMDYSPFK